MMLEEQSFMRQMVEASVAAGRALQNKETGMIHFHYQIPREEKAVTIPLVENFLFILALCRSRLADNVQEAKQLLEHLLHFQVDDDTLFSGNFPIYLHEFPVCNDRALGTALLPIFCRLLMEFPSVLGTKLAASLDVAAEKLILHGFNVHSEKPLPMHSALSLAVAAIILGRRWGREELVKRGSALEEELAAINPSAAWGSPEELGHVVVALQILYPKLSESLWKPFFHYLMETYHPFLSCYAGPLLHGFQSGNEPQLTLYDLVFAQMAGKIPVRAKELPALLLYGALVNEWQDFIRIDRASGEMEIEGYQMAFVKEEQTAFSMVTGGKEARHPRWKGIHDFLFLWGSKEQIHSFVGQQGGVLQVERGGEPNQYIVTFVVGEDDREFDFYLNKNQACTIHVDEVLANSFVMGETVTFKSAEETISLVFHCIEGEGTFRGHVMPGNRPSQLEIKGERRFNAYDWRVFLRRLRGKGFCTVKATITFDKVYLGYIY